MEQTGKSAASNAKPHAANVGSMASKKRLRIDVNAQKKKESRKNRRQKASIYAIEVTQSSTESFARPEVLERAPALRTRWLYFTTRLIKAMISCALCGYTAFKNTSPTFNVVQAPSSRPPYAVANAFMSQFCQDREKGTWVLCSYCSSLQDQTRNLRAPYLVMMKPSYLRSLLSEPCLQLQLLSLIDANMEVHQHFQDFASGSLVPFSLLQNPLVAFGTDLAVHEASANLRSIFEANLRTNSLLQRFQTLLERPSPFDGLSIVAPVVIDSIISENLQRGPLQPVEMDLMPQVFSLLTDARPLEGV